MAVKPDRILCRDQLQALRAMLKVWGISAFCASMLWVLQKGDALKAGQEQPTRIVPFILNPIQLHLLSNLDRHNLLLKARQIGGTTFFLLVRGLLNVVTGEGTNALLISQSREYAELHFMIAARGHRYFGMKNPRDDRANELGISLHQHLLHTKYTNRRELYYDMLESRLAVATAEVEESGQGATLHHLMGSEYSRWPGNPAATLANVRGALAPGGTVDLECTANGAVGSFFEKYSLAMQNPELSDAKAHYYGWYYAPEYDTDLSEMQRQEMVKDLSEDELKLIAQIHNDLTDVTWIQTQPNRVFM